MKVSYRQAQLGPDRHHIHILRNLDIWHGQGRPPRNVIDNFLPGGKGATVRCLFNNHRGVITGIQSIIAN